LYKILSYFYNIETEIPYQQRIGYQGRLKNMSNKWMLLNSTLYSANDLLQILNFLSLTVEKLDYFFLFDGNLAFLDRHLVINQALLFCAINLMTEKNSKNGEDIKKAKSSKNIDKLEFFFILTKF
jgi:hypothetical protein